MLEPFKNYEKYNAHSKFCGYMNTCWSWGISGIVRYAESWPRGYETFFMLNSAEHEIFSANKYENAKNSWHFYIY